MKRGGEVAGLTLCWTSARVITVWRDDSSCVSAGGAPRRRWANSAGSLYLSSCLSFTAPEEDQVRLPAVDICICQNTPRQRWDKRLRRAAFYWYYNLEGRTQCWGVGGGIKCSLRKLWRLHINICCYFDLISKIKRIGENHHLWVESIITGKIRVKRYQCHVLQIGNSLMGHMWPPGHSLSTMAWIWTKHTFDDLLLIKIKVIA